MRDTSAKVPVSVRALIQRLNRKLATSNEQLKKTRPSRSGGVTQAWLDCGDYYIIDVSGNYVVDKNVDIEKLGRKLKVLSGWERLITKE